STSSVPWRTLITARCDRWSAPSSRRRREPLDQTDAVADGEQHHPHPGIGRDPVVEGPDGDGVVVLVAVAEHAAAPERVVGEKETAGPQPRQDLLVVGGVALLVGV